MVRFGEFLRCFEHVRAFSVFEPKNTERLELGPIKEPRPEIYTPAPQLLRRLPWAHRPVFRFSLHIGPPPSRTICIERRRTCHAILQEQHMRPFITALAATLVVLASPAAFAGEGWIEDFDEAAALAKKEGKDLLVDFTGSDW